MPTLASHVLGRAARRLAADATFGRVLRPRDVAGMVSYTLSYPLSDEVLMMTAALIDFDQHVLGIYEP